MRRAAFLCHIAPVHDDGKNAPAGAPPVNPYFRGFASVADFRHPEIVRRMIADEGYTEGDQWLYSLAKEARRRGTPVVLDNGPELFSESYPMIPRFPPSPACAKTREPNAFRSAAMDPLLGDWIPGRSRMIRPNF